MRKALKVAAVVAAAALALAVAGGAVSANVHHDDGLRATVTR